MTTNSWISQDYHHSRMKGGKKNRMNEWMNSILELEWKTETALELVGFGYIIEFNWNDIMAMNDFS